MNEIIKLFITLYKNVKKTVKYNNEEILNIDLNALLQYPSKNDI